MKTPAQHFAECDSLPIEVRIDRLKSKAIKVFGTDDEVIKRFQIGSFGHHELSDRAWILNENWESYIQEHPTNAFIPEAAALGEVIGQLLHEYYQIVACEEQ